MSYKLETKNTSNTSSRARYGHGSTILGITIHHWGSDGQKHANVVRWLRGSAGGVTNRNSSAHYVVSAGLVTKLADDSRATWHAGHSRGNGTTIGIECRPEMSEGDWDTLVQLCADLEDRHGSLRYYKHQDWKATECPGRYGSRIGDLVDAINAEHKRRKDGGGSKPTPKPTPKPAPPKGDSGAPEFPLRRGQYFGPEGWGNNSISGYHSHRDDLRVWQQRMRDRGWTIAVDGLFGPRGATSPIGETARVARQFQQEKGLAVDQLIGPETWDAAWTEPVT